MTTVTPAGTPVPRPVWFLWDGEESALVTARPSPRVRNIEANPRVTLNFDGDGGGGDIIVFTGTPPSTRRRPRRTGPCRTTWRSTTSTSRASG